MALDVLSVNENDNNFCLITLFIGRLLRAYNIDFNWHRLAAWINIIEQWPYRVSWVIIHFEENEIFDNSTTLLSLYEK